MRHSAGQLAHPLALLSHTALQRALKPHSRPCGAQLANRAESRVSGTAS
uniref:Uncharacterized protein n=1 Tax=Klebsiella pneumoniae TaxID=573 RepID=A0A3G4RJ84_KLEPN|nr:hypothetical protein [Klebsiella pneumoniae]QIM13736.1 hypothetical protein [Klebsiella pneumoniae]